MAPVKGRRYEAKARARFRKRALHGKVKGRMAPMKGRRYKAKARARFRKRALEKLTDCAAPTALRSRAKRDETSKSASLKPKGAAPLLGTQVQR